MCVCVPLVCVCRCRCLKWPEDDVRTSGGAGIIDSCQQSNGLRVRPESSGGTGDALTAKPSLYLSVITTYWHLWSLKHYSRDSTLFPFSRTHRGPQTSSWESSFGSSTLSSPPWQRFLSFGRVGQPPFCLLAETAVAVNLGRFTTFQNLWEEGLVCERGGILVSVCAHEPVICTCT